MCGQVQPAVLPIEDAAHYLHTPVETLRYWIGQGLLPVVKLGGKARSRTYLRRADLDAFIAASTTPATAGPLAVRTAVV